MNGFPPFGGNRQRPPLTAEEEQALQQEAMVRFISQSTESCVFKAGMAGVMGFGLGGVFGLFMSSMSMESTDNKIYDMRFRDQMRTMGRDMAKRAFSSAKNFGYIGLVYSGTECCIEGYRARTDIYNAFAAGAVTGGILAYRSGPKAILLGAAGFSAFSGAIEYYMRQD